MLPPAAPAAGGFCPPQRGGLLWADVGIRPYAASVGACPHRCTAQNPTVGEAFRLPKCPIPTAEKPGQVNDLPGAWVSDIAVGAGYNPPTEPGLGMQSAGRKPFDYAFGFSREVIVPGWAGCNPPLRQEVTPAGVLLRLSCVREAGRETRPLRSGVKHCL